ncbi:hypothetical protein AB4K20DRAFT_1871066 [Rhizopus microsporus]|uniref:Uncharacterized protein n=1 Tax=Rhizopus microsporus TaxID=58291 RepID=A0A1X0RKS7_RHIZD|nr:hypothetical protein BCV71DRAFT_239986 [Rhizopus microsporus]
MQIIQFNASHKLPILPFEKYEVAKYQAWQWKQTARTAKCLHHGDYKTSITLVSDLWDISKNNTPRMSLNFSPSDYTYQLKATSSLNNNVCAEEGVETNLAFYIILSVSVTLTAYTVLTFCLLFVLYVKELIIGFEVVQVQSIVMLSSSVSQVFKAMS